MSLPTVSIVFLFVAMVGALHALKYWIAIYKKAMSDTEQSVSTSESEQEFIEETKEQEKPKQPKKKNQTKWVRALKQWNETNDNWVIPRKGTKQYKSLMKFMNKMD